MLPTAPPLKAPPTGLRVLVIVMNVVIRPGMKFVAVTIAPLPALAPVKAP